MFDEPFLEMLLEYRHFQHWNNSFLYLEIHFISPDMYNY